MRISLLTKLQAFALMHIVFDWANREKRQAMPLSISTGTGRHPGEQSCIIDAGRIGKTIPWQRTLDLSYRRRRRGWDLSIVREIRISHSFHLSVQRIRSQQFFAEPKRGAECAAKHARGIWKGRLALSTNIMQWHICSNAVFSLHNLGQSSSIGAGGRLQGLISPVVFLG